MISDDERREVARKLRVLACTPDEIGITEHAVIRDLGISAGIYDDCCKSEDVLAVADLIDRPTCQMVECTIDHGSRSCGMRCTACGKEFEHVKPGFGWRFCPNCGAEVVSNGRDSSGKGEALEARKRPLLGVPQVRRGHA